MNHLRIQLSVLCLWLAASTAIAGIRMEVFTSDIVTFTGLDAAKSQLGEFGGEIWIYNFDDVERLKAYLSVGLDQATSEEEAQKIAHKRLWEEIGEEKLKEITVQAYKAKLLAIKYQIEKYPAILFNEEAIVYGVTDLGKALQRYIQWKNKK